MRRLMPILYSLLCCLAPCLAGAAPLVLEGKGYSIRFPEGWRPNHPG